MQHHTAERPRKIWPLCPKQSCCCCGLPHVLCSGLLFRGLPVGGADVLRSSSIRCLRKMIRLASWRWPRCLTELWRLLEGRFPQPSAPWLGGACIKPQSKQSSFLATKKLQCRLTRGVLWEHQSLEACQSQRSCLVHVGIYIATEIVGTEF